MRLFGYKLKDTSDLSQDVVEHTDREDDLQEIIFKSKYG
jgi:hypothetical protein